MKKGVSLSINYVIMAIMAIAVLLIVIFLFNRGYLSGTVSISRTQLRTSCSDACLMDRNSQVANIGGFCYSNPLSRFSSIKSDDGPVQHCYQLMDCEVETTRGTCKFHEISSYNTTDICEYVFELNNCVIFNLRLREIGIDCGECGVS